MRIFVAGSSGQVALSLREAAQTAGIELKTAGRPDCDLTNSTAVRRTIEAYRPTAIINAAAYTAVDAAENDEALATAVNADGAAILAAIAADLGVPFIHISTDYVFDGKKSEAYTEDDPTCPTGAYGRSKLAGEVAVQAVNANAIILRTAWVYSPFGKNFCKTMLSLAKSRDELGVVGDQWGNPSYAPDIAAALLTILTKIDATGWQDSYAGLYHLAGSGDTNWHAFAAEIIRCGGVFGHAEPNVKAITTADFPTPAKRPTNSRLNCAKVKATFGVSMPRWQESTTLCVKRLFEADELG